MGRLGDYLTSVVGASSAVVSSLCCVLPLLVIVTGLGAGAFMMTTMKYRAIFLPGGVLGLAVGYTLYLRERRRCKRVACHMVGARLNLIMLVGATLIVFAALALDFFPQVTAELLQRAMN